MKNFKDKSTALDFLKKNKVRLQSLAAAVIVAGSLVGCKNHNAKNNIDNALVITTEDGGKNIVKKIPVNIHCDDNQNNSHFHYIDLVTGNYYSDSKKCISLDYDSSLNTAFPIYLNITNIESIFDYLTSEEISKLLKNEFTNEDFVNLTIRIKESTVEEVKTK